MSTTWIIKIVVGDEEGRRVIGVLHAFGHLGYIMLTEAKNPKLKIGPTLDIGSGQSFAAQTSRVVA